MIDLLKQYTEDKTLLSNIKKLNLSSEHPKFKVGNIITFYAGYNKDILYKSKIIGFDKNDIYVLWDCYWSPIQDDVNRKIKIIA